MDYDELWGGSTRLASQQTRRLGKIGERASERRLASRGTSPLREAVSEMERFALGSGTYFCLLGARTS